MHLATALGIATVDEDGASLFGGHSMRFSGAVHLASHGMELFKLQLLARWASDVILRYVRESPLTTLTTDYLKSENGCSLEEVLAQMQATTQGALDRIGSLDETSKRLLEQESALRRRVNELSKPVAASPAPPPPLYVENLKSGAVHRALLSADFAPSMWATVCGWRYAHSAFQRHSALACGWFSICEKCCPHERAAARRSAGVDSD